MSRNELFKWLLALAIVVGIVIVFDALYGKNRGAARADDLQQRTTTELKLAAGQKLVDVSWRCFSDYACRPFLATRAMRKDETPETYALSSPYADAPDAYVIKESR